MKKRFQETINTKPEDDELFDLSSLVNERQRSLLSLQGTAGTAASSVVVPACAGQGKGSSSGTKKGSRASSSGKADFACGCAVIDKAISSKVLDPIAAACKARKATLREFNTVSLKIGKTKDLCLSVLGKKHEEVHLPSQCVQDRDFVHSLTNHK